MNNLLFSVVREKSLLMYFIFLLLWCYLWSSILGFYWIANGLPKILQVFLINEHWHSLYSANTNDFKESLTNQKEWSSSEDRGMNHLFSRAVEQVELMRNIACFMEINKTTLPYTCLALKCIHFLHRFWVLFEESTEYTLSILPFHILPILSSSH